MEDVFKNLFTFIYTFLLLLMEFEHPPSIQLKNPKLESWGDSLKQVTVSTVSSYILHRFYLH